MKKMLFLATLLLCTSAEAVENTTLNGFQLWQFKDVVEKSLGKPFKIIPHEHSTAEAFALEPDGYMVFEYLKDKKDNIYSIQITGEVSNMVAFNGLRLGDSESKVIKALGKPTSVEKLESPAVKVLYYDEFNASVEIDEHQKLYSIKLHVTNKLMNETGSPDGNTWADFANALQSKDFHKISAILRPDIEIYKGGETLTINKRLSEFIDSPDSKLVASLIGKSDSVLAEIASGAPEGEIRFHEKMGVGLVFKFYNGKIVKEVVFYPYNGRYRVYEILFRANK